jgi:hypothetical protein
MENGSVILFSLLSVSFSNYATLEHLTITLRSVSMLLTYIVTYTMYNGATRDVAIVSYPQ